MVIIGRHLYSKTSLVARCSPVWSMAKFKWPNWLRWPQMLHHPLPAPLHRQPTLLPQTEAQHSTTPPPSLAIHSGQLYRWPKVIMWKFWQNIKRCKIGAKGRRKESIDASTIDDRSTQKQSMAGHRRSPRRS